MVWRQSFEDLMAYYTTDGKTTFNRTIIALLKCATTLGSVYKKSVSPTSNKNLKYISWKTAKNDHNIIEQNIVMPIKQNCAFPEMWLLRTSLRKCFCECYKKL